MALLRRPWETRALLLSHRTRRDKNAAYDRRPGGIGSQWVYLTRAPRAGALVSRTPGADDAHIRITKTYSV